MNFLEDKRLWYAVAALVVLVILYVAFQPHNQIAAPTAPASNSSPATAPEPSPTPTPKP